MRPQRWHTFATRLLVRGMRAFACWAFLSVLFLMHIYWFCLFVRIAVRLLKASEDAHQAGAAEYEGGSEDESSGGEEEEQMKKK